MNWWEMERILMDKATGDGGAGGGAGGGTGGADGGKGAADGDKGGAENLLAGDDGKGGEAKEPSAQEVQEFLKGIPALDLGVAADGAKLTWDDAALKAVAPAMLKAGLKAEQGKAIVAAYAEHVKAETVAAQVRAAEWNRKLIGDCRERFGGDLPRFAKEARAGGLHVFGAELWQEISAVTSFSNDPRVIERLAAIGRGVQQDGGTGAGSQGMGESDFAQRYLRTSLG